MQIKAYPAMDGIRGVAAILVALFHFRTYVLHYASYPAGDGYLAVDLFYVLSGFVLAHAYEHRFARGMTSWQFMSRRLIRLYPLYLVGLGLGVVTMALGFDRPPNLNNGRLIYWALFETMMLPAWSGRAGDIMPINGAAWSLVFEIGVNFMFVAFWPRLKLRALLGTIALSGGAFLLCIVYKKQANIGNIWHSTYGGIPRTIFSFAVGVLISRVRANGSLRLDVPPSAFFASLGGMVCYLLWPVSDSIRATYDACFVFLLSPILVIMGTSKHLDKTWVSFFTFLGSVSYALYVIHTPVVAVVMGVAGTSSTWLFALLSVAALVLVSYLLDLLYDIPVRHFLNKQTSKMQRDQL